MKITAMELAGDSNGVVDRVIQGGETIEVERCGKSVVEMRRAVGVSSAELLDRLKAIRFSEEDRSELSKAMKEASEIFGDAGRD